MAALGRLWPRVFGCGFFLSPPPRPALGRRFPFDPSGAGSVPGSPWALPQVRSRTRGNEYQPNNRKRKRTHGWIRRISTPGGVAVILRRMLKGRKSLTH
ncbi:39S ribosomal protein L34, mitochondrial [Calypte anna]|uniref:39S ribosomal protein L34, mitochondrial n=1 Tax=Calypte anna TaxID=9244 RepID=UPI0011C36806|nr:39S ribosomal protein L34, mitochondrial [Calypte anna]